MTENLSSSSSLVAVSINSSSISKAVWWARSELSGTYSHFFKNSGKIISSWWKKNRSNVWWFFLISLNKPRMLIPFLNWSSAALCLITVEFRISVCLISNLLFSCKLREWGMINTPCYQSFYSKQYLNISKLDAVLMELAKGSCPWGSNFLCDWSS